MIDGEGFYEIAFDACAQMFRPPAMRALREFPTAVFDAAMKDFVTTHMHPGRNPAFVDLHGRPHVGRRLSPQQWKSYHLQVKVLRRGY